MHWLKIWIPSWRLFDRSGFVPQLYVRVVGREDWLPVLSPPPLRWYHLLLNPEGGYHHACCNAVEALVRNPQDAHALQITTGIGRHFLRAKQAESEGFFEFKITVSDVDGSRHEVLHSVRESI